MGKKAVCVACGAFKNDALVSCPECGYQPESEYEVARSLILSQKFSVGQTAIGRTADELQKVSDDIRGGRPYYFDPEEQRRVVDQYREYEAARSKRPALGFLKWLLPLLVLAGLIVVLLWSR
jgi:uncharacterized Zn finger protein (UPF0148 family)